MTRTDIAALALRLAALYLYVSAFFHLTSAATWALQIGQLEEAEPLVAGYILAAALLALGGVVLFRAAPTLARRVTGGDAQFQLQDRSAIGSIALRVAGVVAWEAALRNLPAVTLTAARDPWTNFSVNVGIVVLLAGVGTWLFACAPILGERWFGSSRSTAPTSASILPTLAFAAVGVFVVLNALPMFVFSVVDVTRNLGPHATGLTWSWRELISSLLRLVLGGALVLGGGTAARLWDRLSTAGLNRRIDGA